MKQQSLKACRSFTCWWNHRVYREVKVWCLRCVKETSRRVTNRARKCAERHTQRGNPTATRTAYRQGDSNACCHLHPTNPWHATWLPSVSLGVNQLNGGALFPSHYVPWESTDDKFPVFCILDLNILDARVRKSSINFALFVPQPKRMSYLMIILFLK